MPRFLEAVRDRLRADPALADLADVYLSRPPTGATFPYLVINSLSGRLVMNTTDSYYKERMLQFTVLALSDEDAERLGNAAYDALYPRDAEPPFEFSEGLDMGRYPEGSRGPEQQDRGIPEDDPVWMFSFDYVFQIMKG